MYLSEGCMVDIGLAKFPTGWIVQAPSAGREGTLRIVFSAGEAMAVSAGYRRGAWCLPDRYKPSKVRSDTATNEGYLD
jgi:hypothetical protein